MSDAPSASISDIAYDAETKELRITFSTGRTLTHVGVPGVIAEAFAAAARASDFYAEHIRDHYPRA